MSDRHYVHHEDEVQLAKILKESKPWLEKYGTTLIYALAAVMAVAAVVVYLLRQPPATAEESGQLLVASTPEEFQNVADETPDSKIGIIARLRQAELLLQDAVSKLFTDRKSGVETLDQAATTFQRLSERKDISPNIRERVLAGLARVAEARCDGSDATVTTAVEAWQELLKQFPDSRMFKEIAEDRIRKLPLESTKSFYAWFQKQDPKPGDDLLLPQDRPGKVPDIPNLNIPDFSTPFAPSQSKAAPADPAAPVDGTDSASPARETPAEEKPATPEEKRGDNSEPASEKPASPDDKPAPSEDAPKSGEEKPSPAPDASEPVPEKSGE
jgi:hypothetical protein